ncbi:ATP-dependent 6-phosphofructokinase [Marinobacterium nitratireducens]|uniref:ATP-dependent 6-phosphofructokinase n=1 Tax=Marinobacterium nitratireducens TaxID=518897 RepID=A0A917ZRA7_9GAMM|nr:6-phosphofructokinase [Marinobacterium nitratireducens]GGO88669.1 ATP-dependent 6-phosphofructokinase [Marinobacterium nitratireducens]
MYSLPELDVVRAFDAIGVLTSGGDAPAMNAAVRAVARTALNRGIRVYGVHRGYSGLLSGDLRRMSSASVSNIIQRGGTILKSDRCEAFYQAETRQKAADILREHGVQALITIGGDGTLTGAHLFTRETGIPVVGLPGSIDNDIPGTDDSIGFDTAVNTAIGAIDRIRDTALSHERLFLVEVMGRNSGYIATQVGIACGAEMILIPEYPTPVESIGYTLADNRRTGKGSSGIIVVAEGPEPGLTGRLAEQLRIFGEEARVCILGHIQRGGSPSAHDRVLASCMGVTAVDYLLAGYSDIMVGCDGRALKPVSLAHVSGGRKRPPQLYQIALQLHK